jgi:hypothetical protein
MTPELAPYARERSAHMAMLYRDWSLYFLGRAPRSFFTAWAMCQMRAGESWWENYAKGMGWSK